MSRKKSWIVARASMFVPRKRVDGLHQVIQSGGWYWNAHNAAPLYLPRGIRLVPSLSLFWSRMVWGHLASKVQNCLCQRLFFVTGIPLHSLVCRVQSKSCKSGFNFSRVRSSSRDGCDSSSTNNLAPKVHWLQLDFLLTKSFERLSCLTGRHFKTMQRKYIVRTCLGHSCKVVPPIQRSSAYSWKSREENILWILMTSLSSP